MDHKYAIENHVAEGYLLDDLDERERDAYEDHFFGCSTCADEVETVTAFIDTAKQVIREEKQAEMAIVSVAVPAPSWFQRIMPPMMRFIPATACALFLATFGFAVYQHQVIAHRSPLYGTVVNQARNAKPFTLTQSRRAQSSPITVRRGESFPLQFDIPPSDAPSYQATITTESGVAMCRFQSISHAEAQESIELSVPPGLESGEYSLVIEEITSDTAQKRVKGVPVRFPFKLNVQD
jgi:methionine-rich copper-binding protein CopC